MSTSDIQATFVFPQEQPTVELRSFVKPFGFKDHYNLVRKFKAFLHADEKSNTPPRFEGLYKSYTYMNHTNKEFVNSYLLTMTLAEVNRQ